MAHPADRLLLNAASFFVSAGSLGALRRTEPATGAPAACGSLAGQIGAGLHVVFGRRLLWANAACRATYMFAAGVFAAVYVPWLVRDLGLSPALIGLIFGAGGPGTLLGMLAAGPLARRLGLGKTLLVAAALAGLGDFLAPLIGGGPLILPALVAATFLRGFWVTIYDLHQVRLRQAITPAPLLGRMTASVRFLIWGVMPFGALFGGWLGTLIGPRGTLGIAAIGTTAAVLWLLPASLTRLHALPDEAEH